MNLDDIEAWSVDQLKDALSGWHDENNKHPYTLSEVDRIILESRLEFLLEKK